MHNKTLSNQISDIGNFSICINGPKYKLFNLYYRFTDSDGERLGLIVMKYIGFVTKERRKRKIVCGGDMWAAASCIDTLQKKDVYS